VSTALTFLRWLDGQGIQLRSMTQADIDRWLTDGTTTSYKIVDFVNWAKKAGICGDISVASRISGDPENFHSEEEQVELLKRCVQEVDLPLDVRAAGALVLLYGVSVSRIVQLTLEHVEERPNGTYIALGSRPVLMPPAVAQLVVAQAGKEPRPLVERPHPTRSWLFPGNLAGRPTGATPLANRLISHGIAVRRAKNSAVLALASDLPASILSEILGVDINTAVDWVRFVKRDWADFIEARGATGGGSQESW
jgi:integrase